MPNQNIAEGTLEVSTINKVTTICFGHPDHNALPASLLQKLTNEIIVHGQSATCNVIVLKSAGNRTFCAGAHFDELLAIKDQASGKAFFMGFARLINAIRNCPKIVVCSIQGKAIGGGVGIAAAADYCLASHYASIKLSELTIGIGPFVIGPAVERKIGVAAFSKLTLSPFEWQTAQWAKEKGLFYEVFQDQEQLNAYLDHYTNQLASYPSEAVQTMKTALWSGTPDWKDLLEKRAEISGRLVISDEAQKAIATFKTKN